MCKIQSRMFIAVFLQDIHTMEKWFQKFWKTKFNISGTNTEFRKYRSNLIFWFQQYYHNVKQQYQQLFFIFIFNMTTRGIFNFPCCQKVSIDTLFCQEVSTRTFSFTRQAMYTGYKIYMAISWYNYTFTECWNLSTKHEDLSQTLTHSHSCQFVQCNK